MTDRFATQPAPLGGERAATIPATELPASSDPQEPAVETVPPGTGGVPGIDIATIGSAFLGDLREQVVDALAEREAAASEVRRVLREIDDEIARRMTAEDAAIMKFGMTVARYEEIKAKPLVRESILGEPGVIDELRALLPIETFEKAVSIREIPARTEIKTHIGHLNALAKCGEKGRALLAKLVDRGMPGRRLVIEREQQRVAPAAIGGAP